jgi:hypothetical protein
VKLVITPLFIVTFLARDDHVAGDVQSRSKSVHAVWMFNGCPVTFQQSAAVTTMTSKFGFNCVDVFLISDIESNLRSDFTADFVKKHTHEFVCHI